MTDRLAGLQEKNRPLLLGLGLFLLVFLLYRDALGFSFSFFDDHRILLDQAHLYGPGTIGDRVQAIAMGDFPREEPLIVRDLSWLLDSRLFGFGNPFGYHLGNLVLHAAVVIGLFTLVLRLTSAWVPAVGAGVLFAAMAVNVEPVAWIMGRKDLLAGFFLVMLLNTELSFRRASHPGRWGYYGLGLLWVGLACLSKISAVTYPGVLLLFKWLMTDDSGGHWRFGIRSWSRALVEVLPHFVLAGLLYGWYRGVLADYGVFSRAQEFSAGEMVKILLVVDPLVLLRYLALLLAPASLSAQYTWEGLGASLGVVDVAVAVSVLIVMIIGLGWLIHRRSPLLFYPLAFLGLMVPYLNLIHFGWWYANRYLYAAAPLLVLFAVLASWQARHRLSGKVGLALLAVVLVWNGVAQQRYLPAWQDGESLWQYEMSLPQASLRTYNNLPSYYVSAIFRSPPEQRTILLDKADQAIEQILDRFLDQGWPSDPRAVDALPRELSRTFYLQGAVRLHRGEPVARQLASFNRSHRLNPMDDRVNEALAVVVQQQALAASAPDQRAALARQSLAHYRQFLAGSFDDAATRRRRLALYQQFRQAFPELESSELSSAFGIVEPN